MGLEAEVISCQPRRKGVACAVRDWFVREGRQVPILTDEGWELIKPLMGGRRSTIDRRTVTEALLEKAVTGEGMADIAPRYGVNLNALQTQSNRWLQDGTWAKAMELLKDAETRPAWSPVPAEIKVTLRPLAIECKDGDGERAPWRPGRRRRTRCAPRSPDGPCRAAAPARGRGSP
ncbi:transposase [Streptomyces sp. NPDC014006]